MGKECGERMIDDLMERAEKINCFAVSSIGVCKALNIGQCVCMHHSEADCAFKKSYEQKRREDFYTQNRLKSLPRRYKDSLNEKYHLDL